MYDRRLSRVFDLIDYGSTRVNSPGLVRLDSSPTLPPVTYACIIAKMASASVEAIDLFGCQEKSPDAR